MPTQIYVLPSNIELKQIFILFLDQYPDVFFFICCGLKTQLTFSCNLFHMSKTSVNIYIFQTLAGRIFFYWNTWEKPIFFSSSVDVFLSVTFTHLAISSPRWQIKKFSFKFQFLFLLWPLLVKAHTTNDKQCKKRLKLFCCCLDFKAWTHMSWYVVSTVFGSSKMTGI